MPADFPVCERDFAAYYSFAPAALALRECLRLRAVRRFELEEPILDVGCGDGLFARLAYPGRQSWGIDINPSEVRRAQASAVYDTLICGSICDVHLPEAFFSSAVANCSLEHVPELGAALGVIRRALRVGSTFILIVPTPTWSQELAVPSLLRSLGLLGLAHAYGQSLDRVFRHIHLYDEHGWGEQLATAGFDVEQVETIVTPAAARVFDALLYPSLLGRFTKKLTGRWVLSPGLRALTVDGARAVVNALGRLAPNTGEAGEYLFVCRARDDQ